MRVKKRTKKHTCIHCFREIPEEFIYCEECLEKEKKSSARFATFMLIIICIILSFLLYLLADKYEINYIIVCFPLALLSLLKLIRKKAKDIVEAGNHRKVTQPVSKPVISKPSETIEYNESLPPRSALILDLPFEINYLWNQFDEILYNYIKKYANESVAEYLMYCARDDVLNDIHEDADIVLSFTTTYADFRALATLFVICDDELSSAKFHDEAEYLIEESKHIYNFGMKCVQLLFDKKYIEKDKYIEYKNILSLHSVYH